METSVDWWNGIIAPLIMLALVIAVVWVTIWHYTRPKPQRPACQWCAAGVHHTHADEYRGEPS